MLQGRKRKGPGRPKKHPMIIESDNDESEIVSYSTTLPSQCWGITLNNSCDHSHTVTAAVHCDGVRAVSSVFLHVVPGALPRLLPGLLLPLQEKDMITHCPSPSPPLTPIIIIPPPLCLAVQSIIMYIIIIIAAMWLNLYAVAT